MQVIFSILGLLVSLASAGDALHIIKENQQFGYMDQSGNLVIPSEFREGLAAVQQMGKWGFINPHGEWVIRPVFSKVSGFHEGLAAVRMDDLWGFIKSDGSWSIPPKYESAGDFIDGLASVIEGKKILYINNQDNIIWSGVNE